MGSKMASVSSDTTRPKNVRHPASGKMDYHEHRDRFSEVDGDKQATRASRITTHTGTCDSGTGRKVSGDLFLIFCAPLFKSRRYLIKLYT